MQRRNDEALGFPCRERVHFFARQEEINYLHKKSVMLKKSTENKNHRSLSEYFFSKAPHLLKYSKLSLHFRRKTLLFFRLKLVRDLHNLISSPTYNQTHRHLGDNRFLLVFPTKAFRSYDRSIGQGVYLLLGSLTLQVLKLMIQNSVANNYWSSGGWTREFNFPLNSFGLIKINGK